MGLEANCKAVFRGECSEGRLQWEGDALLFRGGFRLKILAADIRRLDVLGEDLVVQFESGNAAFTLGLKAEAWREKIANPPTLLDKLGVKPGQRVALVNWSEKPFVAELKSREVEITKKGPCDIVFLGAERDSELEHLTAMEPLLKRNGAIWIVYPKGQKQITELSVMAAGKAAGFVDNKTCRFSATHTGLRVVIPLARR